MLNYNSLRYKQNCLNDASRMKNIEEKQTCKQTCITMFKQLYHSQTFSPSFKYAYISFKQSCKTPVKMDLMRIVFLRTYESFKLYIIVCIFHVLTTFYIYQNIHSFSSKFNSLPSKFRKCL